MQKHAHCARTYMWANMEHTGILISTTLVFQSFFCCCVNFMFMRHESPVLVDGAEAVAADMSPHDSTDPEHAFRLQDT